MIDWLSLSFEYENIKDLNYFGESIKENKPLFNFEKTYYTDKFTIVNYNTIKNKKTNVILSGKSLLFYDFNNLRNYVFSKFSKIKCNRIDIAKDSITQNLEENILNLNLIKNKLLNREYISRLKSVYYFSSNSDLSSIVSKKLSNNNIIVGQTIYLGNLQNGNAIFRFYDKFNEFIYRNKIIPTNIETWIRVELQLRYENSNSYFYNYDKINDEKLFFYYLRFIDLEYKNNKIISRKNCKYSKFWIDFLKTKEKNSLNIYRLINSPENKKKYFLEKISGLYIFLKSYYSNFENETLIYGKKLLEKNPYYIKLLNELETKYD